MADGSCNTLVADATVHTSGINWESLITVISAIVVAVSVIVGGFTRYQSKIISAAVDRLGERLESKLETKEKVAELAREVSELRIMVDDIGHRT